MAVALGKNHEPCFTNRVQFTPDVLPSDIGFFDVQQGDRSVEYKPGIVTETNLLLGDEINRTSSKTQSALLEANGREPGDGGRTYLSVESAVYRNCDPEQCGNRRNAAVALCADGCFFAPSTGYPDRAAARWSPVAGRRQNADPIRNVAQVGNAWNGSCRCSRRCAPSQPKTAFWNISPRCLSRPVSMFHRNRH